MRSFGVHSLICLRFAHIKQNFNEINLCFWKTNGLRGGSPSPTVTNKVRPLTRSKTNLYDETMALPSNYPRGKFPAMASGFPCESVDQKSHQSPTITSAGPIYDSTRINSSLKWHEHETYIHRIDINDAAHPERFCKVQFAWV